LSTDQYFLKKSCWLWFLNMLYFKYVEFVVEVLWKTSETLFLGVKRLLTKNIRRSIGIWNWKYLLKRLEMACELNRVKFRTVAPFYTSTTCPKCGYSDRMNRNLEIFRCLKCSHEDNADLNASLNILLRFITGPYGACCKPDEVMEFNFGKIS